LTEILLNPPFSRRKILESLKIKITKKNKNNVNFPLEKGGEGDFIKKDRTKFGLFLVFVISRELNK